MGKKAFVTGGTGFIGSHLVEYLLAEGYEEVRCLVRNRKRWLEDIEGVQIIRGDLHHKEALEQGIEGVDEVYHLAGVTRSRTPEGYYRGNVEATLNVLEAVKSVNPEVNKVLITSSLAAVGPSRDGKPLTEEAPLRPISEYGRSKAEMERRVRPCMDTLPITIVRPPAVYGPREADIYTFFRLIARGICPVIGPVDQPRLSLVHVHDLVRGMHQAASSEKTSGEVYFLGSEQFYSWGEIRDAAQQAVNRKVVTLSVPPGAVQVIATLVEKVAGFLGHYPPLNREKARELVEPWLCAVDKAKEHFGYMQTVSLEEGISMTINWYKQAGWL